MMSIRRGWRRRMAALIAASVVVAVQMPTTSPVSAAVDAQLRRYPYLTDVVAQYATINWATTTSVMTGSATYGIVGSESCTANTVTATRTTIPSVGSVSLHQWEANLTLAPNTLYCYRVFGGAIDLLGTDPSPQFFTQIPAGVNQPYTFAVFGDWGEVDAAGANPWQANLMTRLAASGARFALTTGDNGYPDGSQRNYGDLVQVGSGLSAIFGPQFWAKPGRSMPLFPAIGNHGFSTSATPHPHFGNWPQDMAVSTSGGRYQKEIYCCANGSSSANVPSAWYAFDAGIARFYVLHATWSNGNVGTATSYKMDYDYHWAPGTPQYEWLRADLAAHPSALKFAIIHYPIHSDQASEAADPWLQGPDRLEGLLADNGVDIAFTGHAHIYQRNRAVEPHGLVTYITGGGGADTQSIGPSCSALDMYGRGWSDTSNRGNKCGTGPIPTVRDQVFHYLLVSVNGTQVTVTPTDSLGNTFDVVTYNFPGTIPTPDTEPPGVPANLRTTSVTATEIGLAWDAAGDNVGVTRYELTRDGAPLATVNAPTTTYLDQGRTPGTTYRYAVRAVDAAGNPSAYSSPELLVTTQQAPTIETLTFLASHDATVQAAIPGTNYGNAATLEADGSPDKDFLVRFDVSGIGARQVQSATLYLRGTDPSGSGGTFSPTTTPAWDESTVTWATAPPAGPQPVGSIGSVTAGTTYTLNVTTIVSGDGPLSLRATSSSSNGVDYASSEAGPTVAPRLEVVVSTPPVSDTTDPTTPANLRATGVTFNQVALAWDAATDDVGVTKYELTRDGAALATVNAPATTYTDAAVVPETTYTYAVRALDAAGNTSADSPGLPVTTPPAPVDNQAPGTPTGLTATAASSTRVDLGWVAPSDNVGVTGYEIERNTLLLTTVGAVTTYADTTVTAGQTYTYRVRARDAANNWSEWSLPASATTPTPPPPPSTMSIEASEDAYIRPDQAAANFGALTTLMVDASSEKDFLLKFVVSGTAGRTITSARLRLRAIDGSPAGGEFYDVGDSWAEGTVTWSTAPALGSLRVGTLAAVAANNFYEIDLTSYITGDGTYSLRVTSPHSDGADYVSSEGATEFRPVLTLNLSGP